MTGPLPPLPTTTSTLIATTSIPDKFRYFSRLLLTDMTFSDRQYLSEVDCDYGAVVGGWEGGGGVAW